MDGGVDGGNPSPSLQVHTTSPLDLAPETVIFTHLIKHRSTPPGAAAPLQPYNNYTRENNRQRCTVCPLNPLCLHHQSRGYNLSF